MSKPTKASLATIIVVAIIGSIISYTLTKRPQIDFAAAAQNNITQGVSVDGTVVSAQDLSLAFQNGGNVSAINVQAGELVKQGQVLVKLDITAALAAVNQASAAQAGAEANYQKLVNGQTSASLDVAQTAVDNAQKNLQTTTNQQNQIVQNTLISLLNSNLVASPSTDNISTQSPVITGTYTGTARGQYQITLYNTGSGIQFEYSGLETGNGSKASSVGPAPLGTFGLSIQFPSGQLYANDSWTINIPNTDAPNYLANLNAYNAAVQAQAQAEAAAQAALTQAQATLTLDQTPARPEDIASAQAQMQAASANLQAAQNILNESSLTAPIDGIITAVDAKVGETVPGSALVPGTDVVKMIADSTFQIDTYISEADIGKIKVGDPANVTLDAYGTNTVFGAVVLSIDPSATMEDGITTYKTTLVFNQSDDRIKEGMDANVTITDQTKTGVLTVAESSLITKNNQTYVLVQTDKQTQLQQVQTGIYGIDGSVEIISGLSAGQNVAYFGKQ